MKDDIYVDPVTTPVTDTDFLWDIVPGLAEVPYTISFRAVDEPENYMYHYKGDIYYTQGDEYVDDNFLADCTFIAGPGMANPQDGHTGKTVTFESYA